MNICVYGLWHLGSVTAACLASRGFSVTGLDAGTETVAALRNGTPPLFEPGLAELVQDGMAGGHLTFTDDKENAIRNSDLVWVTFDTPVDEEDRADVEFVMNEIRSVFPYVRQNADVLISSQLPVGSTSVLETDMRTHHPEKAASFYYSPENLRLGKAIEAFMNPARIVVGGRKNSDRTRVSEVLESFCSRIEWMSVESAEMAKHAVNAFLAAEVTFINELAVLCERVGADAQEVERALKSEPRIGARAYLKPGTAFAGGTLARDIEFLRGLGEKFQLPVHLLTGIKASNDEHKSWIRRKLGTVVSPLPGRTIAVLGLTYKPGTDTLRRSSSVELCRWLTAQGAVVQGHDPAVKSLPESLQGVITLTQEIGEALAGASAAVIATEWPAYKTLDPDAFISLTAEHILIDPSGMLSGRFAREPRVTYITVGKP